MVTPILALFAAVGTSGGHSLAWPKEPPLLWQLEGLRLADRGAPPRQPIPRIIKANRSAGWEDTLELEARHLSSWSTGGSHVRSEWAILVTPRAVARWLGYGRSREGWGEAEVQARWKSLASRFENKVAVFFCRTAFPRRSVMGIGSDSPPDLGRLEFSRPQLRSEGRSLQVQLTRMLILQSRERRQIESAEWWNSSPLAVRPQAFDMPPLGDYHRHWWMLEARVTKEAAPRTLAFTISSPGRVDSAVWEL